MILYYAPLSPFSARVMIQLRAKGIADQFEVRLPPGGLDSDEYLELNPLGKIPSLDTGDLVIPESIVILEFIEDEFPRDPLRPSDHRERAVMRALMGVMDTYVAPRQSAYIFGVMRGEKSAEELLVLREDFLSSLNHLENFVDDLGPWAAGQDFTLADCVLAPHVAILRGAEAVFGLEPILENYPKLSAWFSRVRQDEAVESVLSEMNAAIARRFGTGG